MLCSHECSKIDGLDNSPNFTRNIMMTLLLTDNGRRPDLYIALVAAAGTDLAAVTAQIRGQLATFHYQCKEVKASRLIGEFCGVDQAALSEDKRVIALMDAGDRMRRSATSGDAVVSLLAANIKALRSEADETGLVGATAFIIDSLKNPDEVQTLDQMYGRNFYTISVYESQERRTVNLANRIARSLDEPTVEKHRILARNIIDIDDHRDSSNLSQDVRSTFPKGDFFIDASDRIESQISRFFGLVFGDPFITPTFDEYAMYTAKAVSLRSCDLSRQVGAAVFANDRTLISSGFNEVPYPGGGTWIEGDDGQDNRDHIIQYDPNNSEINKIVEEVISITKSAGLLSPENENLTDRQLLDKISNGPNKAVFADSRVRNLIEFGRVVHAEMHAICEAARVGRSVQGAKLYCTTFPCHMCAKHIIAAGLSEVVFIEPYPKSLTRDLYADETAFDSEPPTMQSALRFRPFHGISPVLYRRVFSFRRRKDGSGSVVNFDRQKAVPIKANYGVSNRILEDQLIARLDELVSDSTVNSQPEESNNDARGAASPSKSQRNGLESTL